MPAAIAEPPATSTLPTPEPSPVPSPEPSKSSSSGLDSSDPWHGLDEQISGKKPEQKVADKQPETKVGEEKKTVETKAAKEPKVDPATRRQWEDEMSRTRAEVKASEEVIAKYQAKIAEYEARGKDTTALAERLTQREKELEEARADARAAKAELSPDFKEKWDKPFDQAAEYAMEEIATLQVGAIVEDPETGEKKWTAQRKADWKTDFAKLYAIAKENPAAAMERAQALFGPTAQIVLDHIKDLKRLDRNRQVAVAQEKEQWKEKDAADRAKAVQTEIEQKKRQEEGRKAYETSLSTKITKLKDEHPEWYDEDPADPEGNELLKKGREMFNYEPKNDDEAVSTFARNQLNAITALRERHRNRILKEENAQLKSENEELRKGKPGPGSRSTSDGAAKADDDPMAELDKVLAGKF